MATIAHRTTRTEFNSLESLDLFSYHIFHATTAPHHCIRLPPQFLITYPKLQTIFTHETRNFALWYTDNIHEKIVTPYLSISSWFYWASSYVCYECPGRRDVNYFHLEEYYSRFITNLRDERDDWREVIFRSYFPSFESKKWENGISHDCFFFCTF